MSLKENLNFEKILEQVEDLAKLVEQMQKTDEYGLIEIDTPTYIAIYIDDIFANLSVLQFEEDTQDEYILNYLKEEGVPSDLLKESLEEVKKSSSYIYHVFQSKVSFLKKDQNFPTSLLENTLKALESNALTAYIASNY